MSVKKTNLLEVCHGTNIGGTERAMQEFAISIDKRKFNVIVAVYDDTGPRAKILQDAGIEVIKTTPEGLAKLISDRRIDIVHAHSIFVKHLIGNTPNVQQVVFSRGFLPNADMNIIISKSLALKTSTCFNISYGKKCYVLYYPQNIKSWLKYTLSQRKMKEYRKKLGVKDTDLVIGRLGRSETSKIDYLVLASAGKIAAGNKNIKFIFVGLPLLYRVWLLTKQSLREKLIFLDEMKCDREIAHFYQAIDIFWHCASRGETFGNVIAEAMIFKKPVITHSTPFKGGRLSETKDNAQIELVDHMVNGMVANYPNDVIAALKILLKEDVRVKFGEAGYSKVCAEYDSVLIAQKFEKICNEVLYGASASIKPTKHDIDFFFTKEYKNRLGNAVTESSRVHKLSYSVRRAGYKIVEWLYLSVRYGLRTLFKMDIEKIGYNKDS